MENLYKLMNERIKKCEIDEKDYKTLFEEYFFCEALPNLLDKVISNIDLTNFEAYLKYENLEVEEKIEIFKIDDDILRSDELGLRINYKLLDYFKIIIEQILKENNLGSLFSMPDYDKDYFNIDTTLGNLIKAYYRYMNGIELVDNYEEMIKIASSSLSDIYVNDVFSGIYLNFLDSISSLIKDMINKISILNYKDFDPKKEIIDEHFYFYEGNRKRNKISKLDILTTNNYLIVAKDMINKFITDYELGGMFYDGTYNVHLKTNLANLMYAYYMELQRIEYLIMEKDENKLKRELTLCYYNKRK